MLIRLNKYLADCGIASRRKAEELILAGQIKVNVKVIKDLSTKIDPEKDQVYYQNKPVKPQIFIYIVLNKPQGYTCTTKKFKGEKNILDLVKIKEKIFPVGRLDKESQGLIFLTNDGDWAHKLTHPKFEIEKEYQIKTNKPIKREDLNKMKKGLLDEGDCLRIKNYKINSPTSTNLILTQGHKREIRRLFTHFKYQIKQLKRIRIDKWQLGDLAEGQWQYFQPK
jgi:pseudouridine synthase